MTLEAWIDTRHLYCVFPALILLKLGCIANSTRPDFNDYGPMPELPAGDALVGLGERRPWHTVVLFGPDDCEPIVGRLALDTYVLEPDASSQSFTPGIAMMVTPFYPGEKA